MSNSEGGLKAIGLIETKGLTELGQGQGQGEAQDRSFQRDPFHHLGFITKVVSGGTDRWICSGQVTPASRIPFGDIA